MPTDRLFFVGILNSQVNEVDLVPIAKGIISRWWIVLIAAVIGTALMFTQESDLAVTPAQTSIDRVYESRDETALLALVGIDPSTISPFPSFENQIIQLQEPEMRDKIAATSGVDASVSVSRSEQRFSLLDTVEGDGKTKFTFLSVGTPTYSFSCTDSNGESCNKAIDEYVNQLSVLRKESVISGIDRLQTLLESLNLNTASNQDKIEALKVAKLLVTGELALLTTSTTQSGGTVSTVKSSTYGFGFIGGAILGLLIALQLTLIDKRIRSLSQLSKKYSPEALFGPLSTAPESIEHAASAVVARARSHSFNGVCFIPASAFSQANTCAQTLNNVTSNLGIEIVSHPEINELSASQIVAIKQGVVILAEIGTTDLRDVEHTNSVLESSGKTVVGILLVQSS